MVIIGVDPSMRSYAMVSVGDRINKHKIKVPDTVKDPHKIITDLVAGLSAYVSAMSPFAIYIEEPVVAGARNLQSSLKIARSVGAFMGACSAAGMERVYLVPVSSWKAEVVGNGHATKDDVRAWLDQNEPTISTVCGNDQDLRDAACVALYGERLQRRVDALRSGLQHEPLHARVAPAG